MEAILHYFSRFSPTIKGSIITGIFSLLTLIVSSGVSIILLKIQLKKERERSFEIKRKELAVEEKTYIDKQAVENLQKIAEILPFCYREELSPTIRLLNDYYHHIRYLSDENDRNKLIKSTLRSFEELGDRALEKAYQIQVLMAYCPETLKKQYQSFVEEIKEFETNQCLAQIYEISKNKQGLDSLAKLNIVPITEAKFEKIYIDFGKQFSKIIEGVQKDLDTLVKQLREPDL